jgi:hypothetical protein
VKLKIPIRGNSKDTNKPDRQAKLNSKTTRPPLEKQIEEIMSCGV